LSTTGAEAADETPDERLVIICRHDGAMFVSAAFCAGLGVTVEVVPGLVEVEVAVPRSMPAVW
jgi:hypothetical protein